MEILKTNYFHHITFNHSKPSNIGKSSVSNQQNIFNNSSSLQNSQFDLQDQIIKAANDLKALQQLSYNQLSKIEVQKTKMTPTKKHLDICSHLLNNGDIHNWGEKTIDIIEKYLNLYQTHHRQKQLTNPTKFYNRLTIDQLISLGNKFDHIKQSLDFNIVIFKKQFSKKLSCFQEKQFKDLSSEEYVAYKNLTLEIVQWANQNLSSSLCYNLQDQLIYFLLVLNSQLQIYEEALFKQYIERPYRYSSSAITYLFQTNHINRIKNYKRSYQSQWIEAHKITVDTIHDEQQLIKEYLENFFKSGKTIDDFSKYFENKYLQQLYYNTRLQQGDEFTSEQLQEIISPQQLQNLTDKKEITIIKQNKKFFKPEEDVELYVDIKNIQNLTVKVFEINTENYYIKNKSTFDNALELEGINPLGQQASKQLNDPPIVKKRHLFKFGKLASVPRGIFIVEFMGNGITSRAIIRKGSLSHLEKQTLVGHQLTLVNENYQVCVPNETNPHTGIWISNRFIKANEKGQVIVPYGQRQQSLPIIIVHNEFAELSNLTVKTEAYQFKAAYLYHEESFLRGSKAKIIIQPRLFVNDIPCSMKMIEEANISAILVNEQDIPNTYNFKNSNFTHNQDIEIEVPVQNLIKSLSISITCKIKQLNGEYSNISHFHNINFNVYDHSEYFCNLYLQKVSEQEGYYLYALGKNGEPKKNMKMDINLTHKYISKTFNFNLQTDSKGGLHLGQLKYIKKFSATMGQSLDINQCSRSWILDDSNKVHYPSYINVIENDVITLPATTSEVNQHQYELYESFKNYTLQNLTSKIIYKDNKIIIKGLKQGQYRLVIKQVNQSIDIVVLKGEYWKENRSFIINKENSSFTQISGNIDQNLQILNIEKKQKDLNIKVQLPDNVKQQGALDLIRLHAFVYNFQVQNESELSNKLRDITGDQSILSNQLGMKKSVFLNNKQLGDEVCYVLDRKNQKKYIGNTLEKPGILLKKTFNRDTQFEKENLQSDVDYKDGLNERRLKTESIAHTKKLRGKTGGKVNHGQQGLDSMLNFLQNPCRTFSNLKVNEQGICQIKDFPYDKNYSQIQIVATNLAASVSNTFNIQDSGKEAQNLSLKDMRMNTDKLQSKPLLETLKSIILKNGQSQSIKTDIESVIIDNIPQFFDIQKECSNEGSSYKKWDFLQNWPNLNNSQKLKKYDEFACHEMNIFLYMKDRDFFEKVVYTFIQNKIQKSFVDYFLLNDKKNLQKYSQPQNLQQINYMEKCLLVSYLFQNNQQEQAKRIADFISLEQKAVPEDTQNRKQLFNTVISAKSKSNSSNKMTQLQKEMEQIQQPVGAGLFGANQSFSAINVSNNSNGLFGVQQQQQQQQQQKQQQQQMQIQHLQQQLQQQQQQQQQQQEMLQCRRKRKINQQQKESLRLFEDECDEMEEEEEEEDDDDDFDNDSDDEMDIVEEKACQSQQLASRAADQFDDFEAERQIQQRKKFKQGYQKLKQTKEYVERTYYDMKNKELQATIIRNNQFWADLAQHIVNNNGQLTQFLSENFIFACGSLTEMICALSFTDLLYQGGSFSMQPNENRQITIQPQNSNLMVFLKDISEGEEDIRPEITINQRFFDPKDRYTYLEDDPGVQVEKNIDEFIVDKVYGCQIVITNCSIAGLEFQILTQIPQGSIPIQSNDYTKSHTLYIQSYQTQKIEFKFYFPSPGNYKVFPANVSRNSKVVSYAQNQPDLQVKPEITIKKMESFVDIIRNGSQADILKFVQEKNILNNKIFDFQNIYWLLKEDYSFYTKFVHILKSRSIFDYQTWKYALHHKDSSIFLELFNNKDFVQETKSHFDLKHLQTENIDLDTLQIFEYHPLLSARTHNFMNQKKSKILNIQFKETYKKFLEYLIEVPNPSPSHYIVWSYYLLLQERIEEAITIFQKIDPKNLNENDTSRIQYDYMAAYLDIYQGQEKNFIVARELSQKYLQYPVQSWQNLFKDLYNQLQEYDGDSVDKEDQIIDEAQISKNIKTAASEQSIALELDKKDIVINYQNIDEIQVNLYEVDLEILFSRTPFLNKQKDEFAYVKANHTEKLKQKKSNLLETLRYTIPQELSTKNLFILVKTQNQVLSQTYFSTNLKVQIIENYGQVKVTDQNNNPLAKVYVKTYSKKKDGSEQFHRDGYTDLRGRFDYAQSSSSDIDNVNKFSILIISDNLGSLIKEVSTPSQLGQVIEDQVSEESFF